MFINNQAESFVDAMNEKVFTACINAISEYVDYKLCLEQDYLKELNEYNEMIAKIESEGSEELKEESKNIIAPTPKILTTNEEIFKYSINCLYNIGYNFIHHDAADGSLIIQIYKLDKTFVHKFNNKFTADLEFKDSFSNLKSISE